MSKYNFRTMLTLLVFSLSLVFSVSSLRAEEDVKDPNPPVGASSVSINATGGPDGFGYRYVDNNQINGPYYSFIDISATGTPIAGIMCDDCGSGPIDIGFPFNFYGSDYTQVAFSSNGYLNFNLAGDLTDLSNDCPSLTSTDPNNSLYVMWDDLDMGNDNGNAYYEQFADCPNTSGGTGPCTVIMWDNAEHWPNSAEFDFQAILYDNGNILTQYASGNPELGSGSTTGLENPIPDAGLDYACDTSDSITSNLAVCFEHPDNLGSCAQPPTLLDINQGACMFTKSNPNTAYIEGASPNGRVAVVYGLKKGPLTIKGPICNGLELGVKQARLFALDRADELGQLAVQEPVPPTPDEVSHAYIQVVDIDTCSVSPVTKHKVLIDEIQTNDSDGDGIENCDDRCPDQGPPPEGFILGKDGCVQFCLKQDLRSEVFYQGKCYYLDGSGSSCLPGYELAPQSVLETIAPWFVDKDYKTTISTNCCVAHSDQAEEGQDWGMLGGTAGDCNDPGPFKVGPVLGGSGCTDSQNNLSQQLTLCATDENPIMMLSE